MKACLAILVAVATVAYANVVPTEEVTAYGYLTRVGIPEAERIRKAEEEYHNNPSRVVGGVPAGNGQYPWQAGLLIDLVGVDGTGVCGASLVSADRLVTAAHCWTDGINQAWRFTVVLGSIFLFSGGTRGQTSAVVTHPSWTPSLIRNDVAMIYLPTPISTSTTISPIALPFGSELDESFVDERVIVSGFGRTSDSSGITTDQFLSHVSLNVLANEICRIPFLGIVQETNICTSGSGGAGPCGGDSGGPLIVTRNNRQFLIGVVSFGSAQGCEAGRPGVYARVTSFMDFINQHLN